MKRALALALALFTLSQAGAARADTPHAEVVVLDYVSGGRWHEGRPDSIVVGGGPYAGLDFRWFAFGVATHFYYSPSFGGDQFAAELGAYARWNFVDVQLDHGLDIKLFLRGDLYYRTRTANYTDGVVPYVHLGLRVAGIELTTGGALETAQGGKIGGMLVWSLGFDVIEIANAISHLRDQSKPQPP
jgi:hypothetical protein